MKGLIPALARLRNSESRTIFKIRRILYFVLKLVPKDMVVRILSGKLKGKKWLIGSSISASWLGIYEYRKQRLFSEIISPGAVVYDIGANVGFHTLLVSLLAGPQGKVYAFEPCPRNIRYLKKHLEINRCANVTVIEAAVSGKDGFAFLEEDEDYTVGLVCRLSQEGALKVKTVSLDSLVSGGKVPPPGYMKIDVEGAELDVLSGARNMLRVYRPVIFLSTHSIEIYNQCCALLASLDYSLEAADEDQYIALRREVLAFPKEKDVRYRRDI